MEHTTTPGYEHNTLRGITIKNMIATIVGTAMVVGSVLVTYYNQKSDIHDIQTNQAAQNKMTEMRLKIMEDDQKIMDNRISILENEVHDLENQRTLSHNRP